MIRPFLTARWRYLAMRAHSAFLADGSEVAVYPGRRLG